MSEEPKEMWIEYETLLKQLEQAREKGIESHLLLGNGFNDSIGISTKYDVIFQKMMSTKPVYKRVKNEVKKVGHDIERYLGILQKNISNAGLPSDEQKDYLSQSTEDNVKYDFLMALFSIVRKNPKLPGIKKEKLSQFLRGFSNYFTLNYDPFLYLHLTRLNGGEDKFDGSALDDELMETIEKLHSYGIWKTEIPGEANPEGTPLINLKDRGEFAANCVNYLRDSSHNKAEIVEAVNAFWERRSKEKKRKALSGLSVPFYDGFEKIGSKPGEMPQLAYGGNTPSPANEPHLRQNLYYLHGALHIMQAGSSIIKIPVSRETQVDDYLNNALDPDNKDLVMTCVLSGDSKKKEEYINDNPYLRDCLNALRKIEGYVIILGSSLDDNDAHIFRQLMGEKVKKLYISTTKGDTLTIDRAKKTFGGKDFEFFDYEEISYTPGKRGRRR